MSYFSVLLCVSQHAATVLLHHPCIASRERVFLSVLARSCLTHYILTSHPLLARHRVRKILPLLLMSGLAEVALAKLLPTFNRTQMFLNKRRLWWSDFTVSSVFSQWPWYPGDAPWSCPPWSLLMSAIGWRTRHPQGKHLLPQVGAGSTTAC